MELPFYQITVEHLRHQFDELERRVGMAAILASSERAALQTLVLDAMDAEEQRKYLVQLRDMNLTLNDDVENAQEDIESEVRDMCGIIDGYQLATVEEGALHLIRNVSDRPDLFRPFVRLTFDPRKPESSQYEKVAQGIRDRKNIVEPLAITSIDEIIVQTAVERLVDINKSFEAKQA